MKKIIGARVKVRADKVDAFLAAAQPLVAGSRAEAGCISYTLYQDPSDRTVFFFFEEWRDQAAVDAHFAAPHFTGTDAWLPAMLDGEPSIVVYDCPGERRV
jgi:quinol monooxygenase YgiN